MADQTEGMLRAAQLVSETGLDYHVIDSEWSNSYVRSSELKRLLAFNGSKNPVKTVVTVSARHDNALALIDRFLKKSERHEVTLSIVAGNPVFLSPSEQQKKASKEVERAVAYASKKLDSDQVFVGYEGVSRKVTELAASHDIIPFLLYGPTLEDDVKKLREVRRDVRIAVYLPFLISSASDVSVEGFSRLWRYALRRRWVHTRLSSFGHKIRDIEALLQTTPVKELFEQQPDIAAFMLEATKSLSIQGESNDAIEKLQLIRRLGAEIVIGLPLIESESQIEMFGDCVNEFKREYC